METRFGFDFSKNGISIKVTESSTVCISNRKLAASAQALHDIYYKNESFLEIKRSSITTDDKKMWFGGSAIFDLETYVLMSKIMVESRTPLFPSQSLITCSNIIKNKAFTFASENLTALRCALSTVVTHKILKKPKPEVVVIIGTGLLGLYHSKVIASLMNPSEIYLIGKDKQKTNEIAEELAKRINKLVVPGSIEKKIFNKADLIISCTNSNSPVVKGEWLKPGCHVASFGSHDASVVELNADVLLRSVIILTDSISGFLKSGDYLKSRILKSTIQKKLVLPMQVDKPHFNKQITLWKSVGTIVQDLAIIKFLLKEAL